MSRMGSRPVSIPDDVDVSVSNGIIIAEGPQGKQKQKLADGISAEINEDEVILNRRDDSSEQKSQHGLMRTLVKNNIKGVHEKFTKTLEINGLGYRANKQGSKINIELGYSNPRIVDIPENLEVEVPNNTTIKVLGNDNQKVGEFAAQIRSLRSPDPYNQKGIKYEDETIRQKVGKAVGGEEGMGEGEGSGAGGV